MALTIYGDLDVSIIDEMPPGRQPVETYIVPPRERERTYTFTRSQIDQGYQGFFVYPLVEQGDNGEILAAVEEQERLQTAQTTASTSRTDELISGAGSVFGALMGGRRSSRSIATAVRSVSAKRGRTTRAAEKVEQYGARIEDHTEDLTELETTLADAIVELDERWALVATATLVVPVPLEKNDITVSQVALAWVPVTR